MATIEGDPTVTDEEPEEREPESALEGAWYESRFGVGIVAFDVVLTLSLVLMTMGGLTLNSDYSNYVWVSSVGGEGPVNLSLGLIPWYVYVFSLLGALGFIFTTLFDDFDRDTGKLLEYNFGLPAALPLGAGVYLLAGVMFENPDELGAILVGTVFLSGLYVKITYKRFGALAERLLPASNDDGDEGGQSDGGAST